MMLVATVMTIAGSDSGGGAGIQADLKTFAAFGVYGTSAITAITAQNTHAVTAVHVLPAEMVAAQIDAIVSDIGADIVKTGMLANAEIIETVAVKLQQHDLRRVVVDPVMVAKSGDRLLEASAIEALKTRLLPLATVLTPNLPEAEVLVGAKLTTEEELRDACRELYRLGAQHVVLKGGHRPGPEVVDLFYDGESFIPFTLPRVETTSTHGTGCTLASAIAANLAIGHDVTTAVVRAKEYLTEAIRQAFPIGHGHGPVNHFWAFWQ
jgi:hydroxymethylpyrimidine/phosphomethylpyrimidine kinase